MKKLLKIFKHRANLKRPDNIAERFQLYNLLWSYRTTGIHRFNQIFFKTISGNTFRIYENFEKKWVLLSSSSPHMEYTLSHLVMDQGLLKVGESFSYDIGQSTDAITDIIAVSSHNNFERLSFNEIENNLKL